MLPWVPGLSQREPLSAIPAPTVALVSWVLVPGLPWLTVWPRASHPLFSGSLKPLAAVRMSGRMQFGWLVRIPTCSLLLFICKSLCQTPAVLRSVFGPQADSNPPVVGPLQHPPPTVQFADMSPGGTALIDLLLYILSLQVTVHFHLQNKNINYTLNKCKEMSIMVLYSHYSQYGAQHNLSNSFFSIKMKISLIFCLFRLLWKSNENECWNVLYTLVLTNIRYYQYYCC